MTCVYVTQPAVRGITKGLIVHIVHTVHEHARALGGAALEQVVVEESLEAGPNLHRRPLGRLAPRPRQGPGEDGEHVERYGHVFREHRKVGEDRERHVGVLALVLLVLLVLRLAALLDHFEARLDHSVLHRHAAPPFVGQVVLLAVGRGMFMSQISNFISTN